MDNLQIMCNRRTRKRLTLGVLVTALSMLSLQGAVRAQTVSSFEGDRGPGAAVCKANGAPIHCDRAEMDVAASGRQVVQVTWQNVNVYNSTGKLLKSTPLSTVIRDAGLDPNPAKGGGPFEPHIVYDEFIERWIITVTCLNDCTLVSAGADATGAWGGAYLLLPAGRPCLDRNPAVKLGYDRNGVYICGGHIGDDNPHTVPGVSATALRCRRKRSRRSRKVRRRSTSIGVTTCRSISSPRSTTIDRRLQPPRHSLPTRAATAPRSTRVSAPPISRSIGS